MNHYPWEFIALLFVGFCLYALTVIFKVNVRGRKRVEILETENLPMVSKIQTTKRKPMKLNAQGRWLRNHC